MGLGGGILGLAVAIAWFCLSFLLRESTVLFGYALLPVASMAGTWVIYRLWHRRSFR